MLVHENKKGTVKMKTQQIHQLYLASEYGRSNKKMVKKSAT